MTVSALAVYIFVFSFLNWKRCSWRACIFFWTWFKELTDEQGPDYHAEVFWTCSEVGQGDGQHCKPESDNCMKYWIRLLVYRQVFKLWYVTTAELLKPLWAPVNPSSKQIFGFNFSEVTVVSIWSCNGPKKGKHTLLPRFAIPALQGTSWYPHLK